MVIFTSRLFDAAYSPLILNELASDSNTRSVERRVARSATLDGGAVIFDGGFSDGDRDLELQLRGPSASDTAALLALIQADGLQRCATVDGVFEGSLARVSLRGDTLSARFLVRERLSA